MTHEDYMRRALALARRGLGRVEPNPMVGCVIVRDGRIVGNGFHHRFGGAHAEVEALRAAGRRAAGATVYVTLEPCCYFGKTPPCTDALIAAGVRRVVAAMRDPNPRVAGGGFRALRAAEIAVECGVLEAEAARLVAPFVKLTTHGRPWVIAKWAQSIDGAIGTRTGDSKWITDEAARADAHRTRSRVDGIMVGVGTVLADDPLLTCRHGRPRRVATRIVLDSRLRTPPKAQPVRTANTVPTLIYCAPGAPGVRRRRLEASGVEVVPIAAGRGGLSLHAVLDDLGRRQMANVLVEGGGTLLGRLMDERLADEAHVYVAPTIIGGAEALRAIAGEGAVRVADALRFSEPPRLTRCGEGWRIDGLLR
ncbi:MAG: Riboflavin biosynthesis protein RibD [Phycisphaerae bacterium]|nr:Riboflavin biosynthesis protein RibD [Phycisphaerae bacterium]